MRKRDLLPLALLVVHQARAAAAPWNCTNSDPIQVLSQAGAGAYKVMQLNFATNTFTELWSFGTETASAPATSMNGFGYNPVDGIAYGVFEDAGAESYLCRFDATADSQDCLCKLTAYRNAATITADGTFYMSSLGANFAKIPLVHNLVSPPSPAPVASLGNCGETTMCTSCKATSPQPYVPTAWALTAADMLAAYDLPVSCSGNCYMSKWTYDSVSDSAPRSPRACVRDSVGDFYSILQ